MMLIVSQLQIMLQLILKKQTDENMKRKKQKANLKPSEKYLYVI